MQRDRAVIICIDKEGKIHETNIKDLKVEHKPSDWKPILIEGKARFKLYNNKETTSSKELKDDNRKTNLG